MSFNDFETAIKSAVAAKRITGASIGGIYKTKDGLETYLDAFGKESLEPSSKDMSPDSLLWIASCTKLITAIAVLQVFERGLVTLDEPLSDILTEYKPLIPIVSLDPSTNELKTSTTTKPLTLRLLLTHTAGFAYDWHPPIQAWKDSLPETDPRHGNMNQAKGSVFPDHHLPLIYEPAEPGRWEYGPAIDMAGKVVERVNPEKLSLGEHMQKYIFEPLGIKDSTFRPLSDPEKAARLFPRSQRMEDGSLTIDPMTQWPHKEPVDETGGGGLYSTARDYLKILESLLLDDGKLLKSESIDELFRPQLDPTNEDYKKRLARNADAQALVLETEWEGQSEKVEWNWSLCGLSVGRDVPGKAKKGTGCWSGLANCYWWVDRNHGTAGFYGSQVFPFGDVVSERLSEKFRKTLFELADA